MKLEQYGLNVSINNAGTCLCWYRWPKHACHLRSEFENLSIWLVEHNIIRPIIIQIIKHGTIAKPLIADRHWNYAILEKRINDKVNGVINKAELIVRESALLQWQLRHTHHAHSRFL